MGDRLAPHTSRSTSAAKLRLGIALSWLLLAVGCGSTDARLTGAAEGALSGRLVVTGSSTLAPLVAEIGRRFEAQYPDVRVDVQTGGSSRGIRDARNGSADIGMASRALTSDERMGLRVHPIASDEIGLVVHADNVVGALSADQVRGIYLGRLWDWEQVGGEGAPITVIHKAAGRATRQVFVEYFDLEERAIEAHVVIGDNEQGIKTVASAPHAIAYVSVGAVAYHRSAGVPIRRVQIDGDAAAPIRRTLHLVAREEVGALARAFIDYSQSPAASDLVRDLYLLPISSGGEG